MSGPRFLAQPCAARRLCCAWWRSGKRIPLSCLKGKAQQYHQGINAGLEFDGHNRAATRTKGAPSGHGCRARGPSPIQKVGGNDSGRSRVTVTAVCPLCKATVTQYHIRCRAAVWQQAAPPISKDRQACGHRTLCARPQVTCPSEAQRQARCFLQSYARVDWQAVAA